MTDENKTSISVSGAGDPSLPCPTCQKTVFWNDDFPFRPFCCERCKLIDLGEWAAESHRIAGDHVHKNDDFE